MLIDLILLAGLVWCIIEIRAINSVVERRGNIFNNSSKDDPT